MNRQEMELEGDKKKLTEIVEITAERRKARNDRFKKGDKKEKDGVSDALKNAERYKSMVFQLKLV